MNPWEWFAILRHRRERGHAPVWYNLGAGQRQCVECLHGGKRAPRSIFSLVPVPLN